jgi:hypothetical protein
VYEAGAISEIIKVFLTSSPSRATYLVAAIVNCAVGHLVGEQVGEVVGHVVCKSSTMFELRSHLQPIGAL